MQQSRPQHGPPTFASQQPPDYQPRNPERTVLHATVRGHLETFLDGTRERGRPVPRFVEREFRQYLDCGVLAHGFLRVHCGACGNDRLVAFSCKGRGFCPSCGGRRMADTAAHLVDRVFPVVPVRQWVLLLPFALRFRLAYDAGLLSAVLRVFLRAVFASLQRRARQRRARGKPQPGAVTFVQRFGDALNLNVHFHTLVLDGVFEESRDDSPRFHVLPPPEDRELERVARAVARGIERLLRRRGYDDMDAPDPIGEEQPLLAALYAASVRGRAAGGRRAGQRPARRGDRVDAEDLEEGEAAGCARAGELSLHAGVAVPARDRKRLERLCRYVARPPLATKRLSELPDGRLLYQLRKRWRDGSTHVVFEPSELLERLAALVPPPRAHQVRYHGILGPRAGRRSDVVPRPEVSATPDGAPGAGKAARSRHGPASDRRGAGDGHPWEWGVPGRAGPAGPPDDHGRRYSWAELLRRMFAVDVLACSRCSGRLRILAAIHPPEATTAILGHLGLPTAALPNAPPSRSKLADLLDPA